jgi:hypothetical protein
MCRRPPGTNGLARARQAGRVRVAASDVKEVPRRFFTEMSKRFRHPARRESSEPWHVGPSGPELHWRCGERLAILGSGSGRSWKTTSLGRASGWMENELRSRAKSHGRPVGKPLRHPTWVSDREKRLAENRLYLRRRKAEQVLSGPRRAQAGSHLPATSARDQRSGSKTKVVACLHEAIFRRQTDRPTR